MIFVGINPSAAKTRKGSTLDRLSLWANRLGLSSYQFMNVIQVPGPYHVKLVDFDYVKQSTEGHEKVIALGGFVSGVLKRANIRHFTLPHPSPLNRNLNSKEYENRCLEECRLYLSQ